jgi:hypothetical protein
MMFFPTYSSPKTLLTTQVKDFRAGLAPDDYDSCARTSKGMEWR